MRVVCVWICVYLCAKLVSGVWRPMHKTNYHLSFSLRSVLSPVLLLFPLPLFVYVVLFVCNDCFYNTSFVSLWFQNMVTLKAIKSNRTPIYCLLTWTCTVRSLDGCVVSPACLHRMHWLSDCLLSVFESDCQFCNCTFLKSIFSNDAANEGSWLRFYYFHFVRKYWSNVRSRFIFKWIIF